MSQQVQFSEAQVKGCAGCLAVPIVGVIAMLVWAGISDHQRNQRIEKAMKGRPDAVLSSTQLLNDNLGNYDDLVVQVSGVVDTTSVSATSAVLYLGPQVGGLSVWCYFPDEWVSRINQIRPGDHVTVRGVAMTGLGAPIMQRCVVVNQ